MDEYEYDWFECDEELGEVQHVFIVALRARALTWAADPVDSRLVPPERGYPFVACLNIDAPQENFVLLTVGVHLEGHRLRGDRLHHQDFTLPEVPTSLAMEVSGSPEELAEQAADWFEAIISRPVVRYEWLHAGQVYASRYLFPDTGEGLSQMYNRELAPPGQQDRLLAAGHFTGRGWIDTRGLGEPDRVAHVRGRHDPPSKPWHVNRVA
ncbi:MULTISPECIES: hypothetical protein [Streptosporangium]|uniref:Uncharacterized protein n=1 Tax=Streptosporangium brasiliense TaxID=47480 RepID=A0ABT9R3B7_9ACTN|nr:hypothetical protein [Streptosporangium brasiliense]MDP9863362.1 hypothetical protein [Streptosporangium brasiliense]